MRDRLMATEALALLVHSPEESAVALKDLELVIGRRSDCGLVLEGPDVSKNHARVVEAEEGYILEDLGSANGTFLNGRRIERARIEPGDEIRIGRTRLTVRSLAVVPSPPGDEAFDEGDKLREEGRLAEAAAAYERGLDARPGDNDRRLELGRILEAAGLWERAEDVYRAVPAGADAHAEAVRARKRLEEKRHIYEKVKSLLVEEGPAAEVLVGSEERVAVEGPGWSVHFPLSADPALLNTLAKTLARARQRLKERLESLPQRIVVEVYRTAEELRRASPAPTEAFATWMAGVYDGTIRIAIGKEEKPETPFLVLLLTHEVAHLAVEAASGGRCPAWLDEGIAQLLAQNLPHRAEARLREAARREALIPLKVLEGPLWRLEEKPLVDLAYAEAYSVVAFLEEAVGWEGLRALLAALGGGSSLEEALEAVGWPYPRLEAAWQVSLMAEEG